MSESSGSPTPISDRIILGCIFAILIVTPLVLGAARLYFMVPVIIVTFFAFSLYLWKLRIPGAFSLSLGPLGIPLLLFLGLAAASCAWSHHRHDSLLAVQRLMAYCALFILVVNVVNTRERMTSLVGLIVGMGALLSLIGIVLYLGSRYYRFWLPGETLSATYMNRDHFSAYLEMAIPLAGGFLFTRMGREKKFLAGFLIILMLVAFVLAASRGAWVSLLAAVLMALPFVSEKRLFKGFVLVAILVGIIVFFALSHFDLSLVAARARTIIEGVGVDETRILTWQGTAELIRAHPWLGSGIGTFVHVFPQFRPIGINLYYLMDYAHNDYLHMTAELGFAGLALIVWIISTAVWTGLREFCLTASSFKRGLSLGATIGVMSVALHSCVDFSLHIPANAILLVTLFGIIMGLYEKSRYD